MPAYVQMVGLPGVGKSTLIKKFFEDWPVVSSDNIIEELANHKNMTYDEAFPLYIDDATKRMNFEFDKCVREETSFVHDQTNLSHKKRKSVLRRIPNYWFKVCFHVEYGCQYEDSMHDRLHSAIDWHNRLSSRSGKTIPAKILKSMINSYTYPHNSDFDITITYDMYGELRNYSVKGDNFYSYTEYWQEILERNK